MQAPKTNIELEKKLLSALMLEEGGAIPQAASVLKADDFYREEHKIIYRALLRLSEKNTPVDVLLVEQELIRTDDLKRISRLYLYNLVEVEYTTARVESYVKEIKEMAQLRRLAQIGRALTESALTEGNKTSLEILSETEQKLTEAVGEDLKSVVSASDAAVEAYGEIMTPRKGLRGVPTGFSYVDKLTNGLKKSELIILAARPSMGKTTLAMNIATNAAKNHAVLVFSLEMSRVQIVTRIMSAESRVPGMRIEHQTLTEGEIDALTHAVDHISNLKFYIDDTAGMTLTEIRMKAQKLKREQGLGLIVIDYLQLMQCGNRYSGNRNNEISELSRGLKLLAKELNVPILALSQLSRNVEMRAEKRPMLSDLRDSGSIEQDADIVMFLYRDEYYNRDSTDQNVAELIIAKNRNGETGTVPLRFEKEYTLFSNLTR